MIFHCSKMTPWNVFNHFNYNNKEIKYKGNIYKKKTVFHCSN